MRIGRWIVAVAAVALMVGCQQAAQPGASKAVAPAAGEKAKVAQLGSAGRFERNGGVAQIKVATTQPAAYYLTMRGTAPGQLGVETIR